MVEGRGHNKSGRGTTRKYCYKSEFLGWYLAICRNKKVASLSQRESDTVHPMYKTLVTVPQSSDLQVGKLFNFAEQK